MHYDVKFGHAVVMTVTDVHAAAKLAEALNDATQYGFQTEDISAHVEETDRGPGILELEEAEKAEEEESGYYDLNSEEAQEWIRSEEGADGVRGMIAVEKAHPRYMGGRKGVIDDAEEYLGELLT